MMRLSRLAGVVLSAALAITPALAEPAAPAQTQGQTVGGAFRSAGHDVAGAARNTWQGVKQGWHATKRGARAGWNTTKATASEPAR